MATGTIDRLLARMSALPVMRRNVDLVVLAYHGVDDAPSFGRHLDHLVAHYSPVRLDEVLDAVEGAPLPPRAALITFDDGERTVLTAGLPEMTRRGLPAVLFAVPGVIDTDRPFWWVEAETLARAGGTSRRVPQQVKDEGPAALVRYLKRVPDVRLQEILAEMRGGAGRVRTRQLSSDEVRQLDEEGVRVENHSMTHPLLDQCTDEKITTEIAAAHERLTAILGRPPSAFAYPNGNSDERVRSALAAHGYRAAFLFDHRLVRLPIRHPLSISRVRVNSTTTLDRFTAIVAGLHPAIHRLRNRP